MPDFDLTPVDYDPFADASNVVSGVPVDQRRGRLVINPQPQLTAPTDSSGTGQDVGPPVTGLPPAQPTPPSIQRAMEHQQNWGMPGAEEQLKNIIGGPGGAVQALTAPIQPILSIAEKGRGAVTGGDIGEPQPPLSDDPAEMDKYQKDLASYHGHTFLDTLGLAAPQMAHAEEGGVGIFGGKGAKTADLNKLVEAQKMEKAGEAPNTIWYATGWGRGRDGQWRFEIDDSNSRYKKQPPMGTTGKSDLMSDTIDHPELFAAYPDLANMPTSAIRKGSSSWGEYYSAGGAGSPGERIRIQNGLNDPRSTMLHELQHAVQQREDFGHGGNPDVHGSVGYNTTSGEVEARNVQTRQDYNAERRQFTPPWLTEDRPRTNQLVRAQYGNVVDAAPGVWEYQAEKKNYITADPHALIRAHEAGKVGADLEDPYSDYAAAEQRDARVQKQPVPVVTAKDGRLAFTSGGGTARWAKDKDVGYIPLITDKESRPAVIKDLARNGDKGAMDEIIRHINDIPDDQLTPEIKAEAKDIYDAHKAMRLKLWNEKYPQFAIDLPTAPEKPAGMELPPKGEPAPAASRGAGPRGEIPAQIPGAPPGWISQRLPTGAKRTENPFREPLIINTEAMRNSPRTPQQIKADEPELLEHSLGLIDQYPNFVNEVKPGESTDAKIQRFKQQVKDNLRFLYKGYEKYRDRSKLWYDGASKMAQEQADKWGLSKAQVAAVMASPSPQKDWFQNVEIAKRVLDTYHTYLHGFEDEAGNSLGGMTPLMADKARELFRIKNPTAPTKTELYQQAMMKDMIDNNRSMSEMTDPQQKAMWIRTFQQTYKDLHYPVLTPEGDIMARPGNPEGWETKKNGEQRSFIWNSLREIGNAVQAIEGPEDPGALIDKLSEITGEKHKVRNFYNNILHPNANLGDVTIDTHAVAAALMRPLSQSHEEVSHNFESSPPKDKQAPGYVPSRGSAVSGVHGTYALYADAYRELADELHILPRELQSVTWEAARSLFTPEEKRGSLPDVVDQIWKDKKLTADQKRMKIHDQAGGFRPPRWADTGN